jgi:transcription elongation factor Elf1
MSVFLQKGGDFMTTLIKTPFKKKRATIAGGDEAKTAQKSPSQTPRSARGGSKARSASVASSVNSCCDDDDECAYVVPTNANIYVDIDDGDDDKEPKTSSFEIPPELPQANCIPLKVSTINECAQLFEKCDEINCSKNNLLLIDDHMMTSIDDHLNNIELINKNLDKLMATQDLIERESLDETIPVEVRAEKKKLKEKIAEKIKMLREARGASGSTSKGSFTSRFKNILRQNSQEEASGGVKRKFLSFRKKSSNDESEEVFEEISKENPQQITDLDEKVSNKFTMKFLKSTKSLLNTKISKKSNVTSKVCRRCSKQFNVGIHHSPASADLRNDFPTFDDYCSCNQNVNDDFNESDDDGIVIKNFEYKDVSLHAELKFSLHYSACSTAELFHCHK